METHLVSDFAHPQIGIQQEVFRSFNPHPGNVLREINAGDFFELLAKIKAAHVHGLGDLVKRKFFTLIFADELLGARRLYSLIERLELLKI